jgi:hypothetical protein
MIFQRSTQGENSNNAALAIEARFGCTGVALGYRKFNGAFGTYYHIDW